MHPDPEAREELYDLKYSATEIIAGKNLVLSDDSIVRGNSTKRGIRLLRRAGVKRIHMRISCPPIINPCYLGIDMATTEELIAVTLGQGADKEILEGRLADHWEIDSVRFLTIDELVKAINVPERILCLRCFGGRYAIAPPEAQLDKLALEAG